VKCVGWEFKALTVFNSLTMNIKSDIFETKMKNVKELKCFLKDIRKPVLFSGKNGELIIYLSKFTTKTPLCRKGRWKADNVVIST